MAKVSILVCVLLLFGDEYAVQGLACRWSTYVLCGKAGVPKSRLEYLGKCTFHLLAFCCLGVMGYAINHAFSSLFKQISSSNTVVLGT